MHTALLCLANLERASRTDPVVQNLKFTKMMRDRERHKKHLQHKLCGPRPKTPCRAPRRTCVPPFLGKKQKVTQQKRCSGVWGRQNDSLCAFCLPLDGSYSLDKYVHPMLGMHLRLLEMESADYEAANESQWYSNHIATLHLLTVNWVYSTLYTIHRGTPEDLGLDQFRLR